MTFVLHSSLANGTVPVVGRTVVDHVDTGHTHRIASLTDDGVINYAHQTGTLSFWSLNWIVDRFRNRRWQRALLDRRERES